jgi:predicted PurR-regulated permease PerM
MRKSSRFKATGKIFTYSRGPFLQILQVIVFGSAILYFGRDVFIPISFALLISFVVYPICAWMEGKGIGRLTAILIVIGLLILVVSFLIALLIFQFIGFLDEWPALQDKLDKSLEGLSRMLADVGVSVTRQRAWVEKLSNPSGASVLSFLQATLKASAFSAILFVLIPVYSVLILYYRQHWMQIMHRLFPAEKKESLREMISLTIKAYYNFIKGMAIVYLIVGALNSIGLLLLGIPHAILFGFIASVLTFVPYIGIIIGSLLPIAIAWVTYDSVWYPVGIVGIFAFVQYLEANVIFPFAVSNRLNVNTLVMLVAIFVGGVLWGMAGMILFVPFVGIVKLIADHNPKWKTVSFILGANNKGQ